MRFNNLKPWVSPLILSTIMSLSGIALWFVTSQGQLTLGLALSLIALVASGFGFSQGFRLGFTCDDELD